MIGPFSYLQHRPCPECGESVAAAQFDAHTCAHDRWLDYQVFQLRDEVAEFESQVAAFLRSPAGRFEAWYAERSRCPRG